MCARQRRSVLLRGRRHLDAPFSGGRNDLGSSAVGLCARCVAARLEPAGLCVAHAARAPLEAIIPHLCPGAHIIALSWDDATPVKLAALLAARGMGRSKLTICEAMGGSRERIRTTEAHDFALDNVASLNTIALEVVAEHGARVLPRAAGLPDEWFEHDGQITKREIRAMTLSSLAPRRGELLWDVGSGSGSVAIEWMLADPANSAVAIERRHDRAERIARNALSFGVPGLPSSPARPLTSLPIWRRLTRCSSAAAPARLVWSSALGCARVRRTIGR